VTELAPRPAASKRLKYVVALRRSRVEGAQDDRPYIGLENIESSTGRLIGEPGATEQPTPSATGEGESLSNTFEPGDVLFGKLRPYLAKVWVAAFPGRCTTELLVMQPVETEPRFLRYVCLTRDFIDAVDASTYGSKMPRADWDFIGNMSVPVPARPKQVAIADYLDREMARLDALMAAKKRVLRLLAEKRRSLITRAVTRGIDPRAPLIDSNIPWLGEIPAHWGKSKFSWSVFIVEGQVDPEVEPYLSTLLVAPNHIESGTGKLTSRGTAAEQAAISGKYLCQTGDVIYSKIRPALRKAILAPEECLCSADMYSLRARQGLDAEYLLFLLLSEPFSMWAVLESDRVAMPKINREAMNDLRLPVPPMPEQQAIVAHIAAETVKLDALRAATERTIALLKERRAALIATAVTGQIDVLGDAA
jgi:type I restriction enzyme S subunit